MPLRAYGLFFLIWTAALPLGAAGTFTPAIFQQRLDEMAKVRGFTVGIAIKDLKSGQEFLVSPDTVFPQGSSIRIHLVTELFRQAAAGKFSVHEVRSLPDAARTGGFGVLRHLEQKTVSMSLRDYAALMIMVNDNTAANFLTDVVGMDNVNASLVAQGTPEIKFRRRTISRLDAPANTPENEGTPRAVMRALELIHQGKVVDRATSDAILEVLALPETIFFRRELPPNVRFAGESGASPTMRCEEGIVLLPQRPYIFCVMFTHPPEKPGELRGRGYTDEFLEKVARLALEYFSSEETAVSPAK